MLLDALLQLCSTKRGREVMREQNVYVILRELFKWETDDEAKKTCAHVIQVLIGDEPETGLQIPEHIKFDDEQLLNTASDEQWEVLPVRRDDLKGAKESVVISFRFLKESLQTYKERKSETQLHIEDLH
ncbi:protein HGH1 homolog [Acropora millepora]|uniref:protein HGH1 homolog n=1 Tax=Acropora millepora TaxID=45264 RepID=UPI001CF0F0B1|nr:protein HGH1 homolog [Acropora millepora]